MSDRPYRVTPVNLPVKTVPTVTPEAVGADARYDALVLQADPANTKNVVVGGAGVAATTGLVLVPGASLSVPQASPAEVWCISADAAQKIRIVGFGPGEAP